MKNKFRINTGRQVYQTVNYFDFYYHYNILLIRYESDGEVNIGRENRRRVSVLHSHYNRVFDHPISKPNVILIKYFDSSVFFLGYCRSKYYILIIYVFICTYYLQYIQVYIYSTDSILYLINCYQQRLERSFSQ